MAWIIELLARFLQPKQAEPIAKVREYITVWTQIQWILDNLQIPRYDAWDDEYFYTDLNFWKYIFGIVRQNLPAYEKNRFDCDKYAVTVAARVYERFKLNSIGVVIGESPYGYHSWSCFFTPDGLYYLEPQTGEIWPANKPGQYKADYILFA